MRGQRLDKLGQTEIQKQEQKKMQPPRNREAVLQAVVVDGWFIAHLYRAGSGLGNSATSATLVKPAALIVPMTSMMRP